MICRFVSVYITSSAIDLQSLLYNRDIHNYNTRLKNKLRLPKVKRNWGKYMMNYHAISDWNALDEEIITSESLQKFKSNFFKIV